ncbi:MAG: hypothetical protein ACLVCH_12215 [Roseburia inulinivorans]
MQRSRYDKRRDQEPSRKHYAKTETPVVSNNSAHRWTPDVPMVVPEINPEHFDVIEFQKKRLGTNQRLCCRKTELLHPELCTGTYRMERI